MKRMISVLLLAAMLAGTAVSCSEKPAEEGAPASVSDTPAAADQNQPAPEEEETELTDGLPDTDMQGFELNILHHSQAGRGGRKQAHGRQKRGNPRDQAVPLVVLHHP